jgi:4-hydroxybutyrate CoA-transferase
MKVKYVSPDEAVKLIKPGHRIYIHSNSAYPKTLVEAMCRRSDELTNVEICHLMLLGELPYMKPEMSGIFRHNGMFLGANTRGAVNEGRADFTPIFLSEIPRLIRHDYKHKVNGVLLHLSPPDKHGYCSYGVAVECTKAAAEIADYVIAQINPRMPRVMGDSFIHVSEIDCIVEVDDPLAELPDYSKNKSPKELEVYKKIGEHISGLIEDGSTLQMGIGAIPDAVLASLDSKKNLGVHTEMFSDGIIPLVEKGVIDCSQKGLLNGKVVTSFVLGSRKLFDFIDDNPLIEMRPSDFVNDPFTISRNNKMVAINSAIEIDLTGQVCADSIGYNFFSGFGGQVDFIRGASRSRGGKAIIALPSTAKNGKVSKIVTHLHEGSGVTTSRGDVHYVVTEYGAVDLHGLSIRERVKALISVAHPNFREELEKFAKEKKYI